MNPVLKTIKATLPKLQENLKELQRLSKSKKLSKKLLKMVNEDIANTKRRITDYKKLLETKK